MLEKTEFQTTESGLKPSAIECIRTYHLRDELEEPFGFSQWYYGTRNTILVEVVSDTGISGWGECYGPAEVYQAAISSFYGPRLIGNNPIATDKLWHNMWRWSLDFARGGIMMGAMSGIDMALWDLKGKAFGVSVSDLIGGSFRETVPCYATGMYFKRMPEDQLLEAIVNEALGYRDQGFNALKIKLGKNLDFDARQIKAMREALPDCQLMADSNHAYDLAEAIRIGHLLDEYKYAWFEEPLSPEYESQFRQLQDKVNVPIATGECEQTRHGFKRLLSTGGVQIAQPDLCVLWWDFRGHQNQSSRFCFWGERNPTLLGHDVKHRSGNAFSRIHVPRARSFEDGGVLLELDRTPNPLRDELFETPINIENAVVHVPTTPGLGVSIDSAAMQKFLVKETEIR